MDPLLVFILPAAVGVISVIYIVYIAASVTREEMAIHDLRVNTMTLRNDYSRQLAERRGDAEETVVGVDIEDDVTAKAA